METTLIACPACTKRFKGKAELAGKKIKCPFCKEAFVVPKAAAASTVPAPAKEEAKKPIRFDDDDDDPGAYGVTTLDLTPRCPNCANEMADEKAFICLFCGYNTLTRAVGKTEKLLGHTAGDYMRHQMTAYICVVSALILAILLIYFDLVLPFNLDHNTWTAMFDAESLRLWGTLITLFMFWGLGLTIYKRLIMSPTPPAKKKNA